MGKLLHFAYPIILSRLVQTLGLVIGNIFVAQLGNSTLAASALATSISIAFFTFANGCLFSLGPKFADYKKNKLMLAQLLSQAFILSIFLGPVYYYNFSPYFIFTCFVQSKPRTYYSRTKLFLCSIICYCPYAFNIKLTAILAIPTSREIYLLLQPYTLNYWYFTKLCFYFRP
ncbi:hypothetical protein AVM71_12880 [Piscirickettsia salmonis]|nr:hypothetical protein AVM71_12880 [Piscirickettsia salmonis]